jgi:hypothetical protein|nr:MAG TPA: hypothetical protein [Caudoviricetes sp.]
MKEIIRLVVFAVAMCFFAHAAYLAVKIALFAWRKRHGREED